MDIKCVDSNNNYNDERKSQVKQENLDAINRCGFPLFSIIVPIWNAAAYIGDAIDSILAQTLSIEFFEVILVDDCSTDNTRDILLSYIHHDNFRIATTLQNSGPGTARNVGIELAKGDWLLFLDSDDCLVPTTLSDLKYEIQCNGETFDIVAFNWTYLQRQGLTGSLTHGLRKDHVHLLKGRDELLKRYLCLQTDGSVIYTSIRRQMIFQNNIRFFAGIHEDVDFLYYVYWYARGFRYIGKVLYGKISRQNSIVNSISENHITGFTRAWLAIGNHIRNNAGKQTDTLLDYFANGVNAVIATRLREIYRWTDDKHTAQLYRCLFDQVLMITKELQLSIPIQDTKYGFLANLFIDTMKKIELNDVDKAEEINNLMPSILSKSWSCVDIQNSVFLRPNEVRTCCKRFFYKGNIHGDVVLLKVEPGQTLDPDDIAIAKSQLRDAINRGDETNCEGCPFLEFKEWKHQDYLDVLYISFEYHSVCNLRCHYCSKAYYGGLKVNYDIEYLINELIKRGHLKSCYTVVWGGGEPVIDRQFTSLIENMIDKLPNATHRILTNAVKFSKTVANLLKGNYVTITTSIDAGTAETFKLVRGKAKLKQVMENLKIYVLLNPKQVTIKYIFTEKNSSLNEVNCFITLIKQYDLVGCNFQISGNFNDEYVSLETIILIILMHDMLIRDGHLSVFIDDLLRIRLGSIQYHEIISIKHTLRDISHESALADSSDYPVVVIWGAGLQAKYMYENSFFFQLSRVSYFVDDTISKIGTKYLGYPVLSPHILLNDNLPIVIAATQGYPYIYDKLLKLGINDMRVIRRIII